MSKIEGILTELRKPFHPSAIDWKPQSITKDGAKGMAIAYADLRAYQNRLDEVCGLDWSVTYTPWGERIVCHLTISGVTRSSTGESDSQSERSEIGGTSAEAQAFKRAGAMFGLGRYLYELPSVWVEMDGKQFSAQAKAKLAGIIATHYRREMDKQPATKPDPIVEAVEQALSGPGMADNPFDAEPAKSPAFKRFHAEGTKTYGKLWDDGRHWLIERYTTRMTPDNVRTSANDLSDDELDVLADALIEKRSYYQKEFKAAGVATGK